MQAKTTKKASIFQLLKAILWGLLGVRQRSAYENDVASITLKQAVIGGLIGGLIFVSTMATLVILAIKFLQP